MIHISPLCPYARRFRLPAMATESFTLPDRETNARTLWHYDRCPECRAYTAHKHGHDQPAGSVRWTPSATRPDVIYRTTAEGCTCPGYGYRGTCRHIELHLELR